MALKASYEKQNEVPQAHREHYTEREGRFVLQLDGEHPDLAKVNEFRTNNVRLTQELDTLRPLKAEVEALRPLKTQFEGLDPVAARAAITENATLKASVAAAEAIASKAKLRGLLVAAALKAGAIENAASIVADKLEAEGFTLEGEEIKAKPGAFSPDRPGEALTVSDALLLMSRDAQFLFKRSSGGGAPSGGDPSTTGSGVRIIKDPTPKQLGEFAKDVRAGKVKFEYSDEQKFS